MAAPKMACLRPSSLHLLCDCTLAALLALSIDAVRLDGVAGSSGGSMVADLGSKASVPLPPDSTAGRAQRDKDLRTAAHYLDSINVAHYVHLGDVRDTLERVEDIRERVLSFGAARDARHRLQIRNILRDVREHGEALKVLAGRLEAQGQVDDGGDKLPTQRDNICSRITEYRVDLEFLGQVQLFCEMLDDVRKAINTGQDEEPMAYSVSGQLNSMSMEPDYKQRDVAREIERVLGEERRWVAKHLVPRPAGTGDTLTSPEGTSTRFRRWALRVWEIPIWANIGVDSLALPFKALQEANDVLANATAKDDLSLGSVRARIQRIDFCKERLVQFISRSDPAFREQVRLVLHDMKIRLDELHALAARKVAAGEVDNSSELPPSKRDNICKKLDASGLDEDFREEVRKICEAFHKLRIIVKLKRARDKCVCEVLGRMTAIERRPGYSDTPVEVELENIFAEEWSWLEQQDAVDGA